MGVSGASNTICIESQTFNKNYDKLDVHGKYPLNNCCIENGSDCLKTQLDVEKLCSYANCSCESKDIQVKCALSLDPGK